MAQTVWEPGPAHPRLTDGAVDVWWAQVASGAEPERELLSEDEHERVARFVDPAHRDRWMRSHGILRALLARYAGADPRSLRFAEGPHGKPWLVDGGRLRFNLAHTGDIALIAVALDREVGVDVELPRRSTDHVAITRRILGDAEAERMRALGPPEREREFLRAWVRWEAALKCRGTGIGGADHPRTGPQPWAAELPLDPPAAAALAVERGPCAVRCWQWPAVGE